MKTEIVVPSAGESVTEADIASWYKQTGDYVEMDEELVELETDKATLPLTAEVAGVLTITKEDGTVKVGDVIGFIEASGEKPAAQPTTTVIEETAPAPTQTISKDASFGGSHAQGHPSPAAAKILGEKKIAGSDIKGTGPGGRITKQDAEAAPQQAPPPETPTQAMPQIAPKPTGAREVRREKMSRLRRTIAQRLKQVQHEAAILTTFNEIDLSAVMDIRKKYKEDFKEKYEVGLGFMSFFTKAVCMALNEYPVVNASIEEDQIIYHDYCDIGIAVSTPRGLVVPIIRSAESMTFPEIEGTIINLAKKGRDGQLTPDDMQGGTFTITNGGVFGSMLSTPIINRPQSAILGMHNIVKRAVVVGDEIKIRPMMYLAVSYDHRIIDGSEAVRFLVKIKNLLEDPHRLLIGL